MPYTPFPEEDETDATDGDNPSTAMSPRPLSDPSLPGGGSARRAGRPLAVIEPPAPGKRASEPL